MKSVLVIRYSALGDVVLATSLIDPLRQKFGPDVRIEWVTEKAYAPLLEGVVDRVIPFSRKDPVSRAAALVDVKGRFDLAIDLQNKLSSIRLARAAAPERRRFVRRSAWQALKSLVGQDVIFDDVSAIELYSRAADVPVTGTPRLVVQPEARARAATLLESGRWVSIAPGAAWETKRWSSERFGQLGAKLQAKGFKLALLGGPMDAPLLEGLRKHCTPDVDLTNESLPVLAAALERSELLIGNDSGLVHIAGAVGSRALALFGPTSVKRWGPREPSKALSLNLPCAPCTNHGSRTCPLGHHDCLQKLEVDRVLETALESLS